MRDLVRLLSCTAHSILLCFFMLSANHLSIGDNNCSDLTLPSHSMWPSSPITHPCCPEDRQGLKRKAIDVRSDLSAGSRSRQERMPAGAGTRQQHRRTVQIADTRRSTPGSR
ncbi:hypothetical protein B0T19DRAFT_435497 [Cercophora scortea]|uniref:Uncharacterized protein n=1 Tax=Cercophora scortea TaxID=314031 RepID=A0AAE0I355_9PEZI|nr:hypothetical protein B0T19DRAFT_435497 [Cercophora scortea]